MKTISRVGVFCSLVLILSETALATQYTWNGHSTVSDDFSQENWTTVAPTSLASHAFIFGALSGPSRTTANNNLDGNPNTFTFNAEAAAMTITGTALQFAGDAAIPIVNNSANEQTFNSDVRQFWFVTVDKKWNAASGNLSFTNVDLRADASATANVTLTIDGAFNTTIMGVINKVGWGTGGPSLIKTNTGILTLSNNSNFDTVTARGGTLRLTGGTLATTKKTSVGSYLGVQLVAGTLEVAGGNISAGTYGLGSYSGSSGALNVTAGNVNLAGALVVGWNSSPTFIISGGTITADSIRHQDGGSGGLTITGSGVVTAGSVYLAAAGGATDGLTFNLNTGGTLVATNLYMTLSGNALTNGTHSLNVNFDGGTLKAGASGNLISTNPVVVSSIRAINVNVKAGGAVIDTNGKTVSVLQPLLHDASLGATPDGGLAKTGAGTLTLSMTNTFSGTTTINEGTLSLSQPNPSNDASIVTMASDATLNLTFTGTDTVKKLYIGGQQRGPGVFGAVGSAPPIKGIPQITGIGTLTVLEGPGTLISFF